MSRDTLSVSLPPHFRYSPSTPNYPNSPFFRFADAEDDYEAPVLSLSHATAKTRLEVLKGWEVNFTILCLYTASFLAFLYVLYAVHAADIMWASESRLPPLNAFERVFRLFLEMGSILLPLIFVCHLFVAGHVTHEQVWTCILLAVGLLATNPLTRANAVTLHTSLVDENSNHLIARFLRFSLQSLSQEPKTGLIFSDAVYTAAIYLYLILAAHSYRVFDVKRINTLRFYAPKIAVALVYCVVKVVAGFNANVSLGLIPFARFITWFLLESSGRHSLRVAIPVVITTLLDIVFGFWLVSEVAATAEFLATVPYVENRAKQLGFRCFVYQTLVFCLNMIGLSILVTYLLPRSYLYDTFDHPRGELILLEPPVARLGLGFVYFTWTLVLAYVNLPPRPILPYVRETVKRALFLGRNSRVAAWLGIGEIETAEDAEDSDDEAEMLPGEGEQPGAVESVMDAKQQIPLRYRHREIYDDAFVPPHRVSPLSPLFLSGQAVPNHGLSPSALALESGADAYPQDGSLTECALMPPAKGDFSSNWYHQSESAPIDIADHLYRGYMRGESAAYSPITCRNQEIGDIEAQGFAPEVRRLRLRKNLFVMETQVLMVNASYLSYIPGNVNEERKPPEPMTKLPLLHTGSLSTDLDDLARQIEEENQTIYSREPPKTAKRERPQPDHDDGTKFLVDPYEMAEKHGFMIYRHFCDEELNTHAIIMVDCSRVVVAFSGTRDATNWGVNANIKRAVLDEKLSRFEYELSDENSSEPCSEQPDTSTDELRSETDEYRGMDSNVHRQYRKHESYKAVRRSRSEDEVRGSGGDFVARRVTVGPSTPRRTAYGTMSSVVDPEREHGEGELFHQHHGVSMVASTFARELLTFGKPKVHRGFIDGYMSLRKQVMGALIELYKGKSVRDGTASSSGTGIAKAFPLFFCGHSLGGALATFASYEAARYYKRIGISRRQDISCTTFGCPKIGNEAFKARYERLVETHWSFEIASDPIPNMPTLFLNYVPVGVRVLVDQSGMLLIDPSIIEVQWWSVLANLYLGYRLHVRASYCMALKTYCKFYKNGTDDLADKFWPFPIRVQTKGLFRHRQQ